MHQTSRDFSDSNGEAAETTSTGGGSIASPTQSPTEFNGDNMNTPALEKTETLPGIKIFDFTGNEDLQEAGAPRRPMRMDRSA